MFCARELACRASSAPMHVTTGRVPDIALIIEIFASQMLNGGVKFGLFNTDLCYNFALKQWFQF